MRLHYRGQGARRRSFFLTWRGESTQLLSSTEKVSCCTVHWSTYLLFPPNCTGIQSSFCRLAKCSISIRKLENSLNTGARARAASSDLFARRQDDPLPFAKTIITQSGFVTISPTHPHNNIQTPVCFG